MSLTYYIGKEEYDLFTASQLELFLEEVAHAGHYPTVLRRTWIEGKLDFDVKEKTLFETDLRETYDELTRLKDAQLSQHAEYVLSALLSLLEKAIHEEMPVYCGQPESDDEPEVDYDLEAEQLMK